MLLLSFQSKAQVKTNFNNTEKLSKRGRFDKLYPESAFEIASPNLENALRSDKTEDSLGSKVFYIAEPIAVNINVSKHANWMEDEKYFYGKFTLLAKGAKTLSINFSNFFLPKGTEMFIYNKEAEMITGVITEAENNENKIWGSSIYKGNELNIEVRLPKAEKEKFSLFVTNVAYGYKDIFINKIVGFGQSGSCNINVLCPLGNGWEPERNSVVFIVRSNGRALCSGAMLMNTCATNIPYVLTADHCFQGDGNVAGWRVHFQAWSATCTPNQNSDGILFNGSTLRANWAPSDFCLVQLNQMPAANSGIHYAGWSRQTSAATSGVSIHHPAGDVMKISNYSTPLVREDDPVWCGINAVGQLQWVVQWNQGVTEGGSSGSPLFDQNHRVVGQLSGGPSSCPQPANCRLDMYGRFDNSWTGGGTHATRLSNWLDPLNSGTLTTTTTNISNLVAATAQLSISGSNNICNGSAIFTSSNVPAGSTVAWVSSNPNIATVAPIPGTNNATVTQVNIGSVVITGSLVGCLAGTSSLRVAVGSHSPYFYAVAGEAAVYSQAVYSYSLSFPWYAGLPNNINWRLPADWTLMWGQGTSQIYVTTGAPGNVAVQVDFDNNCGISTGVFKSVTVGNNGGTPHRNSSSTSLLEIFPNPTNGQITITLISEHKALAIKEVRVKNKTGAVVFNQKFLNNQKQQTLRLNNLPTDIYVVEIYDGVQWQAKKLSVQR